MANNVQFDLQYRKFGSEVLNFIARYVENYSTAEDLTHEVFIKAFKAAEGKSIENFRAYLFASARNHLLNHYRSKSNRHTNCTVQFDELVHQNESPQEENRIEARNELRLALQTIKTLPPRAREAFVLNRIYRYSYKEVGQKMGISPRTVENHVAKGLELCAKQMRDADAYPYESPDGKVTNLAVHRNKLNSRKAEI